MLEEETNRRDSRYTCWKKRQIGEIADIHVGRRDKIGEIADIHVGRRRQIEEKADIHVGRRDK